MAIIKNQIDMTKGSIPKNLLKFAMPLMATNMLQLCYNAADVIVVGRFAGTQALSAVGSTGALINLLLNIFMGLSVGTSVCMGRAFGSKDDERMHKVLHTSVAFAFCAGVFINIAGLIFAKKLLLLMNSPDDVIDLSALYMRIFYCGSIFNLVYNFCAAAVRSVGDTKRPLRILALSGLVNVCLNLILVIIFDLGVAGVAIATITAQFLSMIQIVKYLLKQDNGLKLEFKKIKFHKEEFSQIFRIGLPAGIQGSLFATSNVIIQSSVNSFGSSVMAGYAAAGSIEGFLYQGFGSLHQANVTFTSQNMGAGQYKRVRKSLPKSLITVSIFSLVFCSILYIFAEPLISLYASDADVIAIGIYRTRFLCPFYIIWGFVDNLVGLMRGLGSSLAQTIISIIGICGGRVFWIFVVFEQFKYIETIYYGMVFSWSITLLMLLPVCLLILKRIPRENMPLRK